MEEYMYNKEREINDLKEKAGEYGFMRDPIYTPVSLRTPMILNDRPVTPIIPVSGQKPVTIIPGSKEDIMNRCTAREYYILQHARWSNSRDVIEEFIGILQRLLEEGVFGPKVPEGIPVLCNPDPNGTGFTPVPPVGMWGIPIPPVTPPQIQQKTETAEKEEPVDDNKPSFMDEIFNTPSNKEEITNDVNNIISDLVKLAKNAMNDGEIKVKVVKERKKDDFDPDKRIEIK